jgi:hypothetical protein
MKDEEQETGAGVKAALIRLLIDDPSNPHTEECLADLRDNKLFFLDESQPIETSQVRNIYAIRSKRAKKLSQPMYGFDELLEKLADTVEQFCQPALC